MTTPTAPMKRAGHLRQQVPAVDHPDEEKIDMSMTQSTDTVQTAHAAAHYPWCDPSECLELPDYDGSGEPGVLHRSEVRVHESSGVTGRLVRFVAHWSETEMPATLEFTGLDRLPLDVVSSGFLGMSPFSWASEYADEMLRCSVPKPNTPCPAWCTAETSFDPWIREFHEWRFINNGWGRRHHGLQGKRYNDQFEWPGMDGAMRLSRITTGSAPKHRVLRDGCWRVVEDDTAAAGGVEVTQ